MSPAAYESLPAFAEQFGRGLPALLYHKIGGLRRGVLRRGLYVSPRTFCAQMRELQLAGFHTADRGKTLPAAEGAKRIVITFDDGFASALEDAAPILRDCGFGAINFLVAGQLGGVNAWDLSAGERAEPLMDEPQVRDWLAGGHDIGAHSFTHAHLTRLPLAAAREEIVASKKALEDRFARPVADFAYPFGETNPAIRELVAEAGFERAWTVEPAVITPDTDRLALPRFPVMVSLRRPLNLLRSILPLAR